jgi:pimeloyl-ACP methyl ester carboxylesterase
LRPKTTHPFDRILRWYPDMSLSVIVAVATVLGVLAAASVLGASRIERAHPPSGRFVEADGVRLHVLELGVTPGTPAVEPAVVLIHGASGNLEDMRLALGDRLAASHRVVLIDRPGHGWSARPAGSASASPARQAELIAGALAKLGIARAILVSHSWAGALATAYALTFPDRVAGLVLISPVTHPWPGGLAWYYNAATTPYIGSLFTHTFVYPLGSLLIERAVRGVFAPGVMPTDYVRRAAIVLVLRPTTFLANARDVKLLNSFVAAQAPRYAEITTPTMIITGDNDATVSPQIHSRALAATLPRARLVVLKGVGHMPHHHAPEVVIAAIEELAANTRAPLAVQH